MMNSWFAPCTLIIISPNLNIGTVMAGRSVFIASCGLHVGEHLFNVVSEITEHDEYLGFELPGDGEHGTPINLESNVGEVDHAGRRVECANSVDIVGFQDVVSHGPLPWHRLEGQGGIGAAWGAGVYEPGSVVLDGVGGRDEKEVLGRTQST
jgi:hypothetical protein